MADRPDKRQTLLILHTNDIHSRFERMPGIASVMRDLRRGRPESEVLTLDIGDHMDRMRAETEGSRGAANVAVLNETGYEAVVLGNNEGLTFPPEVLGEAYRGHARFHVLGTNLLELSDRSEPDWLAPYAVLRKGDLNIGLIGVTAYYPDFYKLLGWRITDPFEAVSYWVQRLRGQVHVLIVLSHLGLSQDRRMADEIAGIDVILGGHTHHLLEQPEIRGGTVIAAAGSLGEHVGELEFCYRFETNELSFVRGRCVAVKEYREDENIVRLIEHYRAESARLLAHPVAELENPLPIGWREESRLGNLLAAGIRKWVGAEVGIVNAGQILYGLDAGAVTRGKLLEICPSPINPCRIGLRGEMILQALEESLLPEFIEKPIRGFGFRGKLLGMLCLDGIRVEYDPAAEPYCKIRYVHINGEHLRLNKRYEVGTIDMFTFGIGYTSLGKGEQPEFFLPEFIRDVLQKQLQDPDAVRRCEERHWFTAENR